MAADFRTIETDNRRRDYLLPKSILFCSEGVSHREQLLNCRDVQPQIMIKDCAEFSTENSRRAVVLLDFGAEFFGGVQIVTGSGGVNGVRVRVRFGESASEAMTPLGIKHACGDHSPRDMEAVLPRYGRVQLGQTGFRFVSIELTEPESTLRIYSVQGVRVYRDIPRTGTFACSDELLTRIYQVCVDTVHLNMQNLLWDGTKRDQLVWVGDMHPEILTIRTAFGYQDIVDDSLRYAARANPLPLWPNNITTYGLWYLLELWDWYAYSGSDALVAELKRYWKPLLEQLLALVHEGEARPLIESEFGTGFFLDWPTRFHAEAEAGVYALFCLALDAAVELCRRIREPELMAVCIQKRAALTAPRFRAGEKKQVTAMLRLAGMLGKSEAAAPLIDGGGRGMSTFMSYYILKAAADTAGAAAALDMLREYYGGMLKVGATTFWEDFDLDWIREGARIDRMPDSGEYDIHGDNGRFCYEGFRHSLCHGWSGGPAAFLAETVLGVTILSPGCRRIMVKPNLGDLQWAKGVYPTPHGPVTITAKRREDKTAVTVDAPEGVMVQV